MIVISAEYKEIPISQPMAEFKRISIPLIRRIYPSLIDMRSDLFSIRGDYVIRTIDSAYEHGYD